MYYLDLYQHENLNNIVSYTFVVDALSYEQSMFNKEWTSLTFLNGSQALLEIFSEYSLSLKAMKPSLKRFLELSQTFKQNIKPYNLRGQVFMNQSQKDSHLELELQLTLST